MNGLLGLLLLLFCMLLVMSSGCTSPAIDRARNKNGENAVRMSSSRDVVDASMQVTIHRIRDLHQTEYTLVTTPVTLKKDDPEIFLPALPEPGSCKPNSCQTRNRERKTTVIRDSVV